MNISKEDQRKRRKTIAKLVDKGMTSYQIAKELHIAQTTAQKDMNHITAFRSKMLLNHPKLAEQYVANVEALRQEIHRVRDEYWEMFKEIKEKSNGLIPPKNSFGMKLRVLKNIVDRTEKEVKILNSFNPKNLIINNNISLGDMKKILEATKSIIDNFVPEQYRNEAIQIMMNLDIKTRTGETIIDAEVADE